MDSCPVCWKNLTTDNVVNLKCEHKLCTDCYYSWTDNQGKNSCPCCRTPIYSKAISELEAEVEKLEDIKDFLRTNIGDMIDERDILIHAKVEYDKKIKKQKQKLQELEYDILDKQKYAKKIKANIPEEFTDDPRKLAIYFRKKAEENEKKYDNNIEKYKKIVVKCLNRIYKKNHTISDIFNKLEEKKEENKRRWDLYRSCETYSSRINNCISIGDSVIFKM
jgi:hypothetical protein